MFIYTKPQVFKIIRKKKKTNAGVIISSSSNQTKRVGGRNMQIQTQSKRGRERKA
jgi:hypothetical protein